MRPTFSKSYSRRSFITATAASTFGLTFLPSRVFGANDRLRVGGIGVGGKGSSDIDQAGNLGDVVALCDCDDNPLKSKLVKFPGAATFNDYRKMLEKMHGKLDAVTISTPDNTHAIIASAAMKQGIHVYVQKPLTHDVWEARHLRDLARKHKVVTQMGNQGSAADGLRAGVEAIRSGVIGSIKEIHVWTNRPQWPQSPSVTSRPTDTPAIPDNVHWEEFLGPAPFRAYHPSYHPFKWRGWWDFGTGALGDMGCHTANLAFRACDLDYPSFISAQSEPLNPETYPGWATVNFDFAAKGSRPALRFTWYEGKLPNGKKNLPPMDYFYGEKPADSGSLMVGTKGVMYSPDDYGSRWMLFPSKDYAGFVPPAPTLPRNNGGDQGQKNEWVAEIRGGPKAYSTFDYASMLTETILLGNVAIRAGRPLKWDGVHFRFPEDKAANHLLRRDYRSGWHA
jgi:predicted dehydrogenase